MPEQEIPEAVVVVTEALEGIVVERWSQLIIDAVGLRPQRLIVDLRDSPMADAAGVEVLLRAHREMIRGGGRLVLRAPSQRVRRILQLSRLERVFEVLDDGPVAPGPIQS